MTPWQNMIAPRITDPTCTCGHQRTKHGNLGCNHETRLFGNPAHLLLTHSNTSVEHGREPCRCGQFKADRERYTGEQWEWMIADGFVEHPTSK